MDAFDQNSSYPIHLPDRRLWRGDTWKFPMRFVRSGVPVPMVTEGWSDWKAQFRRTPLDAAPVDITIDETKLESGLIMLTLTSAQTRALQYNGFWDLQSANNSLEIESRTWAVQALVLDGEYTE